MPPNDPPFLSKAFSSKRASDRQTAPKRFPKWSQNGLQNVSYRLQKVSSSVPLSAFAVLASRALRQKQLSFDEHALCEEHLSHEKQAVRKEYPNMVLVKHSQAVS